MNWQGKKALITGGVSGIGFGIARAFSDAGMDLVLTYRSEAYRAEAERWFAERGRALPQFVRLDVTDRGRWAEVAGEAGKVHVLVNNFRNQGRLHGRLDDIIRRIKISVMQRLQGQMKHGQFMIKFSAIGHVLGMP